ncbi:hypothetical protein FB451DRAFT_1259439 [Mycena latifolia]|nr:hypothetical protein FB451DRAFT_1259439 [Mycena latifolia]
MSNGWWLESSGFWKVPMSYPPLKRTSRSLCFSTAMVSVRRAASGLRGTGNVGAFASTGCTSDGVECRPYSRAPIWRTSCRAHCFRSRLGTFARSCRASAIVYIAWLRLWSTSLNERLGFSWRMSTSNKVMLFRPSSSSYEWGEITSAGHGISSANALPALVSAFFRATYGVRARKPIHQCMRVGHDANDAAPRAGAR